MKETQQNAELNTKAEAADSEKPNPGRTARLIAGKTCIGRIRRARLKDGRKCGISERGIQVSHGAGDISEDAEHLSFGVIPREAFHDPEQGGV